MNIIPVSITTRNRPDYVNRTIKSLLKTNGIDNLSIVFRDDSSYDTTKNILKLAPFKNKEIIYNKSPMGFKNITDGIHYCFKKYNSDYVITSDSDMVFHPDWFITLNNIYEQNKDTIKISAIVPSIKTREVISKYIHVDKNTPFNVVSYIAGSVTLVTKHFWMESRIDYNPNRGWDWQVIDKSMELKYLMLSTDVSYVQHIGEVGIHGTGRFGKALQFIDYIGTV